MTASTTSSTFSSPGGRSPSASRWAKSRRTDAVSLGKCSRANAEKSGRAERGEGFMDGAPGAGGPERPTLVPLIETPGSGHLKRKGVPFNHELAMDGNSIFRTPLDVTCRVSVEIAHGD